MSTTTALLGTDVDHKSESKTTLQGPVLAAARLAWFTIFVLTWVCFLRSMGLDRNYGNYGVPIQDYSIKLARFDALAFDWLLMLVSSAVAGFIMWRKSNDWIGLLVSITLVTFGASQTAALMMPQGDSTMWFSLTSIIVALGYGLILILLYVFPDGQFVPSWTRTVSIVWIAWVLSWPFIPQLSPLGGLPQWLSFGILIPMYCSGLLAQRYRRKHILNPIERQQTKWVMFGFVVTFLGFFLSSLFMYLIEPQMLPMTSNVTPVLHLAIPLLKTLTIIAIPVTMGISMMRFRLWAIDPIIHQTVIYGMAMMGMVCVFFLEIYVFQSIFRAIIGQQSDVAIVASSLIIALLFQPARQRAKMMVDRRFYREKVDFEKAFTDFSREIRTIIDPDQLSNVLLTRVSNLLHITHAAVFLYKPDNTFHLENQTHLPEDLCRAPVQFPEAIMKRDSQNPDQFVMKPEALEKLKAGHNLVAPKGLPFGVIVPLIAPRAAGSELVGILAYGPRMSGQAYSREDQNLLRNLADQAGIAVYVVHLIEQQRNETKRREAAERELDAHRNSPLGRAEVLAKALAAKPETAIAELHTLTQTAGEDSEIHALLGTLYHVLEPGTEQITQLASGYLFLFKGLWTPEFLPLGLRTLISQMETPPISEWPGARESRGLYHLAQDAINVQTVTQITHLLSSFRDSTLICEACDAPPPPTRKRTNSISWFRPF